MKRPIIRSISGFWLTVTFSLSLLVLGACQQMAQPTSPPNLDTAEVTTTPLQSTAMPTQDIGGTGTAATVVTAEPAVEATESATATELPEGFWRDLPVIPTGISDAMREVYRKGLAMGNDPHVFTKLGDCNSMSPDFLHGFGGLYDLGEFAYLQPAIDYYQKSFRQPNQATNPGTTTSRLLSSLWTNDECMADELMLDCQFRLDNPSITFIALGTIDAKYNYLDSTAFERNLRVIIESTLDRGIVPILATKADNIEGDNSINETIARLAVEYELPLWNFWRAAQDTQNHGLLPDLEHLNSWSGPPATDFSLPISLEYGKEMKNITALEMLDFIMRELAIPETQATPSP